LKEGFEVEFFLFLATYEELEVKKYFSSGPKIFALRASRYDTVSLESISIAQLFT